MKNYESKLKMSDNIPLRRWNDYVKCENCGYTLPMQDKEKGLCKFCGKYVFKDKKEEFRYRMEQLQCQKKR